LIGYPLFIEVGRLPNMIMCDIIFNLTFKYNINNNIMPYRKSRKLKKSTMDTYTEQIVELANHNVDVNEIKSVSELIDVFDINNFSKSKRVLMLSAIIWHLKNLGCEKKHILTECSKYASKINKKAYDDKNSKCSNNGKQNDAEIDNHHDDKIDNQHDFEIDDQYDKKNSEESNVQIITIKKQLINTFGWPDVLKVYGIIEKSSKDEKIKNKPCDLNYLLLSLLVLHPPRKIIDYAQMYIADFEIPNDQKYILWMNGVNVDNYEMEYEFGIKNIPCFDQIDKSKNYCVLKDGRMFFVFFNYSADANGMYGAQIIDVDDNLKAILDAHIKYRSLNYGDRLINIDYTVMSNRISKVFKQIIGKQINGSKIRLLYVNYLFGTLQLNRHSKLVASHKMGYKQGMTGIFEVYESVVVGEHLNDDDELIYKAPRSVYKTRFNKNNMNVQRMTDDEYKTCVVKQKQESNRGYYLRKKTEKVKIINNQDTHGDNDELDTHENSE